jgi:hypothetical protein
MPKSDFFSTGLQNQILNSKIFPACVLEYWLQLKLLEHPTCTDRAPAVFPICEMQKDTIRLDYDL